MGTVILVNQLPKSSSKWNIGTSDVSLIPYNLIPNTQLRTKVCIVYLDMTIKELLAFEDFLGFFARGLIYLRFFDINIRWISLLDALSCQSWARNLRGIGLCNFQKHCINNQSGCMRSFDPACFILSLCWCYATNSWGFCLTKKNIENLFSL